MRVGCRAVIIKDHKIVLIYRENKGRIYYVYPGGGLDQGETKEECVVRECKEELGINVVVKKHLYKLERKEGAQHFYLCEWIDGILGTGNEEEYADDRPGGIQKPIAIELSDINEIPLVPEIIKEEMLKDIKQHGKDMSNEVKLLIE